MNKTLRRLIETAGFSSGAALLVYQGFTHFTPLLGAIMTGAFIAAVIA